MNFIGSLQITPDVTFLESAVIFKKHEMNFPIDLNSFDKRRLSLLKILFVIVLLQISNLGFAQENLDPVFEKFKGKVYDIPPDKKGIKYKKSIEELPVKAELEWGEINIPETQDDIPFPGVNKLYGFGIIFKSTMKISQAGYYKFELTSDDGSVFWIDDQVIIDNDNIHQMRMRHDSVALEVGNYPIKIWYFQGFPDRYGIMFKGSFYRNFKPGESVEPRQPSLNSDSLKMVIPNQVLNFEHDRYQLDKAGKIFLDSISNTILTFPNIEKIIISGHTDNVGKTIYNIKLSTRRAESIRQELQKNPQLKLLTFEVKGYGDTQPMADNNSKEGRSKNRRVEIEVLQKTP